jgi:hypothetical protein
MNGLAVTTASNGSVLSSMNDLAFRSKICLGDARRLPLTELHGLLANMPLKPLEYRFASDVAKELLSGAKPEPSPIARPSLAAPPLNKASAPASITPPIRHVNRRGEAYYLLVGKTKTGKPKYYVSKRPQGTPAEKMPEGYEFHESPADQALFFVEVEDDSLVVYWPDRDPDVSSELVGFLLGGSQECVDSMKDWAIKNMHFTPLLRFTLMDEERRLFTVERWCFLGSIDDWIHLDGPAPLAKSLKKYVPHLGQESLYELM